MHELHIPRHGFAVSGTVMRCVTTRALPNLYLYHLGICWRTSPPPSPNARTGTALSKFMNSESSTGHFIAENGVAVPAVTAEEMRELDRIATEETGPSLLQMLEKYGR